MRVTRALLDAVEPEQRIREHDPHDDCPAPERWARIKKCQNCEGGHCRICPCGRRGYCNRPRDGQKIHGYGAFFRVDGEPIPARLRRPLPAVKKVPDEKLAAVYKAIFAELDLLPGHREAVMSRGVPEHRLAVRSLGPISNPASLERRKSAFEAARKAAVRAGLSGAGAVPLVSQLEEIEPEGSLLLGWKGIDGEVVRVQLRPDKPRDPKTKYRFPAGTKTTCHVAKPRELRDDRPWITEGWFKSEVPAAKLGAFVIGLPSATGGYTEAVELARGFCEHGRRPQAVVALDADYVTNKQVSRGRDRLVKLLTAAGFQVWLATWPIELGKGLDDLLQAGGTPTLTCVTLDGGPGQGSKKESTVDNPAAAKDVPPAGVKKGAEKRERWARERAVLTLAGQLTDDRKAAKALERAAKCCVYGGRMACKCEDPSHHRNYKLAAESHACASHCGKAMLRDQVSFYRQNWIHDLVVYGVMELPDDKPETGKAARAQAKKKLRVLAKAVRFFLIPGALIAMAPKRSLEHDQRNLLDDIGLAGFKARLLPVGSAITKLEAQLAKRWRRLQDYIDKADASGLATDPWTSALHTTSAGSKAKKLFPHPTKKQARDLWLDRQGPSEAPEKSPCGFAWIYQALDEHGVVIGERTSRPYGLVSEILYLLQKRTWSRSRKKERSRDDAPDDEPT